MICPGDKVRILNEKAEGTVKKILGRKTVLVTIEDFDFEYPVENILKAEEPPEEKIPEKIYFKESDKIIFDDLLVNDKKTEERKIKTKKGKKPEFIREIDLHCHEIISNLSGMNSSGIFNFQIKFFLNELEKAIVRKERKIIFIHGKGEGILKAEIHRLLNTFENIKFFDAPMRFYGGGATQVEIH